MSTPFVFIESEVASRLAALKADDEPTGETNYRVIPKTNNEMDDGAFNRSAVRTAIVDTCIEIVGFICKTEGDPRRQQYRLTTTVAHGGQLPSAMGPYGAVYDAVTGRSLVERSASDIFDVRGQQSGGLLDGLNFYFYATDGTILYHTLSGNATVEYFKYDRPYTTYSELDSLFDAATDLSPLPDEFGVVAADGAAGRLCMKAGSFISEGAAFLQAYYTALRERGLNATASDFPARPAA